MSFFFTDIGSQRDQNAGLLKKKIKKKLKNPGFWSRCEPISVKKNDTLGCEKKIQKKIQKNKKKFLKNPEFWSHRAKIPVKKNDTLG